MALPTLPAVPDPSTAPVRMAVIVPLLGSGVSLLSTSVSLLSTLPLALAPPLLLLIPPASLAMPMSSLATGASLLPRIVIVSTARSVSPPVSLTV